MQIPYRKPGKFSQLKNDPLMTKEKHLELQRKLAHLKEIQPFAVSEVSRLAELGDFSENAEYQLAKAKLRSVNNNILKLDTQIHQAEIIESPQHIDEVQIGSSVTVQNERGVMKIQILGSSESNPQQGIVSHSSPIGIALLGHQVGDEVIVALPEKEITYQILKIE